MGTYRDNTPNFNVKKVSTFSEFDKNKETKETEDLKRTFVKNSDNHKFPRNSKLNFNKKTNKMDDVTMDLVDDKLKSLKSLKESTSNEALEILNKISMYLEAHPGTRFAQALFNLDINVFEKNGSMTYRDIYNDSDEDVLKRVNKNF